VPVYCVYVLVIEDFLLLSFKFILRSLFNPHHINQVGVQKTTPQVTLYKSDTAKESLRRRRADRDNQVLSVHAGQARELLLVLLPPHERVCVVGHLLYSPIACVDDHLVLHSCCNMPNLWSYISSCTCPRSLRPIVEDLEKVTTFLPL
jgi:hypothetical protein